MEAGRSKAYIQLKIGPTHHPLLASISNASTFHVARIKRRTGEVAFGALFADGAEVAIVARRERSSLLFFFFLYFFLYNS
jgi:hypothetical protein